MSTFDPNVLMEAARSGVQRTLIQEMVSTLKVPYSFTLSNSKYTYGDPAMTEVGWSNLRGRLEELGVKFEIHVIETADEKKRTGYIPVTLPFVIVEQSVDFPFKVQRTGSWVRSPEMDFYHWQTVTDIKKMEGTSRGEALRNRMLIHAVNSLPLPEPEEFGARVVVEAYPIDDGETAPTMFLRVSTDPHTLGADWLSERGGYPITWDEILPYDPRLA